MTTVNITDGAMEGSHSVSARLPNDGQVLVAFVDYMDVSFHMALALRRLNYRIFVDCVDVSLRPVCAGT
ncbi:hypothetical protein KIN20_024640 [Parelaphostrongylus tenuis]|uniref:Uncharacterized protein n=1 Tax=Parelaphostrongylus tenuis TaxID=148309 RepID=A0AAD5NBA6_PARTN|nr:hypothetical protein KIN20_024640 [Parelaphostrongylus tenuis]